VPWEKVGGVNLGAEPVLGTAAGAGPGVWVPHVAVDGSAPLSGNVPDGVIRGLLGGHTVVEPMSTNNASSWVGVVVSQVPKAITYSPTVTPVAVVLPS
jgi:hypothetical protein